jgi:hypothetical protein
VAQTVTIQVQTPRVSTTSEGTPGAGERTPAGEPTPGLPWLADASLFGSGRDALASLVRWGARRHGWRRVWLPSYNCPEVPAALLASAGQGTALRAYPDTALASPPDLNAVPATSGDVVVVVNQLGIRPRPDIAPLRARGVAVVEDHSHDPGSTWALESSADYAFASLRKTLPVPDGGAVWSPLGLDLPPEPTGEPAGGNGRSAARLAVALEARGRRGAPDGQLRFLALARVTAGSREPLSGAAMSPVSRALVREMPVRAWRERRRRNLDILADAAAAARGAQVLAAPAGGTPFALTLLFGTAEARGAVQRALIARAVMPAVLWPLDPARDWGAGPADADLSARILSLHGDQRFGTDDMRGLAAILREVLGG